MTLNSMLDGGQDPCCCEYSFYIPSLVLGNSGQTLQCSRVRGHAPTGHEYVGLFRGEHIHLIWGELA